MPACGACGQENPAGAKFCLECGSPFAQPKCASCGSENPAGAKFCLECGSSLGAAPPPEPAPPAHEERKVITALFTDIVGSTATAEQLDPEDVRARLKPYYDRVRRELESHSGTVEKFIGDAVVAVFGAPVSHEDDPERAVRAALAVREAVAQLNADDEWLDLHLRTAVHTGEALVVLDASAREGEGIAAGDVMNTAARIQGGAPVDGIVVGEATYRATAHVFEYREAEPVPAKGKAEPVRIWELVGERLEERRPVARTPIVGRTAELALLTDVWGRTCSERRPHAATVMGPPGIGKTRLLVALCERAERDGSVHWGRCLSYGEGITYWPVIELVKDAAGIRPGEDAATVSEKLGELLERLPTSDPDELRTIAAALANLVGAPTTPRGTYEVAEIAQAELHWGIRRLFQLLAREQPRLFVVEDLHWAEPTLLELFRYLYDDESNAPLLLIGSARPELRDRDAAFTASSPRHPVLEIAALDAEDSRALADELLGEHGLDRAAVRALVENAAGNPLFLEETARMVAQSDVDAVDPASLPVPDSLQALIGARLDALPPTAKTVAQHASVVGLVFWAGAVAHLGHTSEGALASPLDRLVEREVVRANEASSIERDREYAFIHALVHDVAYERLPRGGRAALHTRFAEWLRERSGGADMFVEILAYHLEQACHLARSVAHSPVPPPVLDAVDALTRSARKAEQREGMREADRFYERALEVLRDEHPEIGLELRLRRCGTLVALGQLREAYDRLLDVEMEAEADGRQEVRCEALVGLANIDRKQGRASEARERLADAEILAVEIGERRLEVRAAYELCSLRAWFDAEADGAIDGLERAIATADSVDERPLRIEGRMRLGSVLFNAGRVQDAEEQLERALALADETGSLRDDARATSMLGLYRYYLGDLAAAEQLALQALEWLERTCDSHLQLQNLRALAKYALARDDPERAEEHLREALPLALEAGGWLVIEVYRYLVEALVHQERVDEAAELVAFASRNLPEEDLYARGALRLAEALVAAARDEETTAVPVFAEAMRLIEEAGQQIDLAEARVVFARALRASGDTTAARVELELARSVFAGIEARGLVDEIDRELAEIQGAGVAGPL